MRVAIELPLVRLSKRNFYRGISRILYYLIKEVLIKLVVALVLSRRLL